MSVFNLDKMFHPQSLAVVGASDKQGSIGNAIMQNLQEGGFTGKVFPVNPHHSKIAGLPSYPGIADITYPIDLAIIAVPIDRVPGIISECTASQVGGAVIISAGGKETGVRGKETERAIASAAEGSDLRIIGPNCIGVISVQACLNASFAAQMPLSGKMAFVSQSGAICTSILDLSLKEQIGFSYFINLGSMLDVDFGDMIDYLGGDPRVSSIVLYIEGLTRFRNFMSAARAVSRVKPIIALKAGRSKAGARAAASHTGALSGEDPVYDAAFSRAGIVRVKTFEELFDCAELCAKQPRPNGPDLAMAIISNAGGPGVMAADALSDYGIEPAKLRPETIEKLDSILPSHWSCSNPIDILGDSSVIEYVQATEICLDAPEINGLLIMLAPQAMIDPAAVAEALVPVIKNKSRPVITSWIGGPRMEKGCEVFNRAGIPTFDTPERAVRAFIDLYQYSKNMKLLQEIPPKLPQRLEFDFHKAKTLIQKVLTRSRSIMTEVESKQLLSAYDIPVNRTETAFSAAEAAHRAEEIGFPVAVKVYCEAITHKSDAGGVKLNLQNASDVRQAYMQITENARTYDATADVNGVSVQPMVTRPDYELILGAKKDRDFGPVILFGMGGVMTEVMKDRALALPPLNRLLARRLMQDTKVFQLLEGYRNHSRANLELLEETLIRLSHLMTDFAEIAELDINPLLVTGNSICAVDARVILESSQQPAPLHLSISSYPTQYETHTTTKGLIELFIRPIRPEDAPLLEELFASLSPRSIYQRFFTPLKTLPHSMLARFTQIDYDREIALVAFQRSRTQDTMLGIARIILGWDQTEAEFAVLVGDPWQGKGIGAELLRKCLKIARERNIEKIRGSVLAENTQMLALGRSLNFNIHKVPGESEFELELDLQKVAIL